jgi:dTDP-4-dehydrorhamnose reductase
MKCLITGLNGTLAPFLARVARERGFEVLGWPREQVSPDDVEGSRRWLAAVKPDAIAHLGMGSAEWAGRLAAHAAAGSLPFVFTSTAMVFHHWPDGPHALADDRNAEDGYGQYKRAAEDAVRAAYPQACIARLGWQIDAHQPGNNMLMALDQWQASQGCVKASRRWTPACSFMDDTAAALADLWWGRAHGLAHIDSNAEEGHSFFEIARALRQAFTRPHWQVVAQDDYVHDQRLLGGGERVPRLSARLPQLQEPPAGG